ncbi:DUF5701 family protein [Blastococcus haudaquaticus]|uniref:Uncharacterized protein n=1 Tax=Blastococcus haudaquaticus TaxID=1938745 RepID=A0A286GJW6_9ACTN|nr:DUF5701 family protein [Blastococcus haudaquaticus]SOD95762.1 hypothetical protein SAMN06272739_1359 [Blastococcus haudaquaticus]
MTALPVAACPTEAELEFDRQVDALVMTGLPEALELAEQCFRACAEPLRDLLPPVPGATDRIPFVVVFPTMPVGRVLGTVHTVGGTGFTTMSDDDLASVRPSPDLEVPLGPYLLLDVDLGGDTVDTPPEEALTRLAGAGRTPLTLAEGVAVLVSDPGVLRSRNAFSLAGSHAGDQRVPALWQSARRPRLGWWEQTAPHTWLGTASCGGRREEPSLM